MMTFVRELTAIPERQGANEQKAVRLILRTLSDQNVPCALQRFEATTPRVKTARLTADGEEIPCIATCFTSGEINGKHALISSLISSQRTPYDANINFSPESDVISRSNHYFAPALAIAKKDVPRVLQATNVHGVVDVEPVTHQSANILIGNHTNPRTIFFCHYDSLGPGATDNAAGTAVLLNCAITDHRMREQCLFVIAGNEELSYDNPLYWGHGYRVFEKEYAALMGQARQIVMVDCVGNGTTTVDRSESILRLSFPLAQFESWKEKLCSLYGDADALWKVYHSEADTIETVNEDNLQHAVATCRRLTV